MAGATAVLRTLNEAKNQPGPGTQALSLSIATMVLELEAFCRKGDGVLTSAPTAEQLVREQQAELSQVFGPPPGQAPEPPPAPPPAPACRILAVGEEYRPGLLPVTPELAVRPLENATVEEAERQGEWARNMGRSRYENPYPFVIGVPSDLALSWAHGWRTGDRPPPYG